MNYETIKQYARQTGHKVTDLIALAPQNDPFYMGTPTDLAMAEWFAGLWRAFGDTTGGGLPGDHLPSGGPHAPPPLPHELPRENTVGVLAPLQNGAQHAR